MKNSLHEVLTNNIIERALNEDLGWGDVTTSSIIGDEEAAVSAYLVTRQDGVLAGMEVFERTIQSLDREARFERLFHDGDRFKSGDILLRFSGRGGRLLSAERTALNFLQHLSGVATLTAKYVKAVEGTKASIVDTRKTTPGLRVLEKYAVRCGGGRNHRFNLSDMVLLKDNHIVYAGGIKNAVNLVKSRISHSAKIEVEVTNFEQLEEALDCGVEIIMLDNMKPENMKKAVEIVRGRALLEASGTVSLETVGEIAKTGVDIISVGKLTHSAPVVDISMNFSV